MKRLIVIALLFVVGFSQAADLSRLKTWTSGEILTVDDLNNEYDNIINYINGSLTATNFDTTGRFRMDTLDATSGIRIGSTPSATLGNILWANGNFHISVSKDSAGVVDKTSDQTVAGTKTFSGYTVLGSAGVTGGGTTMSSHVWFAYLPESTDSLIPTTNGMMSTKFYVDSLIGTITGDYITTAAASDTARTASGDSVAAIRTERGYDLTIADTEVDFKDGFRPSAWTKVGEAVDFGEVVYYSTDSTWMLADADTVGTAFTRPGIGFATADITNGSSGTIMTRGVAHNASWTWTKLGSFLYLSTTAGALTESPDTSAGKVNQIVGYIIHPDMIIFDANFPYARK